LEDKILNWKTEKSDEEISAFHQRRREVIKNILIIFLVILLLLTFFSNTIMNKSLPEIATYKVSSGNIAEKVRISGFVEANNTYDVMVDGTQNRTVTKVFIKAGKKVKKGDSLFTITGVDSLELSSAKEMLKAMQDEYEKSLLKLPVDYASENMQIRNAREDLQALINKRGSTANTASQIATLQANRKAYQNELNIKSALVETLSGYLVNIEENEFAVISTEYAGNLLSLQEAVFTAQLAYDTAYENLSRLLENGASESMISSAQSEVSTKEATLVTASASLFSAKNTAKANISSAKNSANNRITELIGLISSIEEDLAYGGADSVEMLDEMIKSKQRELESLILSLEYSKKGDNINQQAEAIALRSQKEALDTQKKLVDDLIADSDEITITADSDGIVSEVFVKNKETIYPDLPLATIALKEEGYIMTATVPTATAKKLKVGTAADVSDYYYWGEKKSVILKEIKNAPGGNSNKILVFTVLGDTNQGDAIDVYFPTGGGGNYETIVPKSAVYEDSDGKFILIVTEKSSSLGNRYYASRVNITIVEDDGSVYAINAPGVYAGTEVITSSSKPISSGKRVRLKTE